MAQTAQHIPSALERAEHPLFLSGGRILSDRLYTTGEAAIILGVGASTLRRWRQDGTGPKVTRLFSKAPPRYRGADLLAAINAADAPTNEDA